jgi:hypothetical protein
MQPDMVEDVHTDPVVPNDPWAAFLSARFSRRKELYQGFSDHEKDIVKKELRRIRYLREYFEEHRLCTTDTSSLTTLLNNSHAAWRDRAGRRCQEELRHCEVDIARATGDRLQELKKQRLVLMQVQQWPTQEYAHLQESMAPESYISGLDAIDGTVDDDNPAEPGYGYNGWVMAFRKNEGGITLNHRLCHGEFPHQTISMQSLLYDKEHTPLKRSVDMRELRYFHVQANNMKWVEVWSPFLPAIRPPRSQD